MRIESSWACTWPDVTLAPSVLARDPFGGGRTPDVTIMSDEPEGQSAPPGGVSWRDSVRLEFRKRPRREVRPRRPVRYLQCGFEC